jgi:hypothetical protein
VQEQAEADAQQLVTEATAQTDITYYNGFDLNTFCYSGGSTANWQLSVCSQSIYQYNLQYQAWPAMRDAGLLPSTPAGFGTAMRAVAAVNASAVYVREVIRESQREDDSCAERSWWACDYNNPGEQYQL